MQITPKRQKMLAAHGKIVRHDGKTYRIIANTAGPLVLASADQIFPNVRPENMVLVDLINSRSNLARTLGDLIEKGLVS